MKGFRGVVLYEEVLQGHVDLVCNPFRSCVDYRNSLPDQIPGDQYYLVYYGNKHIKTYDASVYALPQ